MQPESSLSMRAMERGKVILSVAGALLLAGCSTNHHLTVVEQNEIAEKAAVFDLVDVRSSVPGIEVDLRYKDSRNVLNRRLYPQNMPCLVKSGTAAKLRQVMTLVGQRGFRLKIWDGWRPPEVQALFYDKMGHTGLFLDPKIMWSRHCTGTAVDVTLVTMKGKEVEMPTDHDEAGPHARYEALDASREARRNLAILQHSMHQAGFLLIDTEWWHFDDGEFAFNQPRVVSARDLGLTLPE